MHFILFDFVTEDEREKVVDFTRVVGEDELGTLVVVVLRERERGRCHTYTYASLCVLSFYLCTELQSRNTIGVGYYLSSLSQQHFNALHLTMSVERKED